MKNTFIILLVLCCLQNALAQVEKVIRKTTDSGIWEDEHGEEYRFRKDGSLRVIKSHGVFYYTYSFLDGNTMEVSDGKITEQLTGKGQPGLLQLKSQNIDGKSILGDTVLRYLQEEKSWKKALESTFISYVRFGSYVGELVSLETKSLSEKDGVVNFTYEAVVALPIDEYAWAKEDQDGMPELNERAYDAKYAFGALSIKSTKYKTAEEYQEKWGDFGDHHRPQNFRVLEKISDAGTQFTVKGSGIAFKIGASWTFQFPRGITQASGKPLPTLTLQLETVPGEPENFLNGSPELAKAIAEYKARIEALEQELKEGLAHVRASQEEAYQNSRDGDREPVTQTAPVSPPEPPRLPSLPETPEPGAETSTEVPPPSVPEQNVATTPVPNTGVTSSPGDESNLVAVKIDEFKGGVLVQLYNGKTKALVDETKHSLIPEPTLGEKIQVEERVAIYVGAQAMATSQNVEPITAAPANSRQAFVESARATHPYLIKIAELFDARQYEAVEQLRKELRDRYPNAHYTLMSNIIGAVFTGNTNAANINLERLKALETPEPERTALIADAQALILGMTPKPSREVPKAASNVAPGSALRKSIMDAVKRHLYGGALLPSSHPDAITLTFGHFKADQGWALLKISKVELKRSVNTSVDGNWMILKKQNGDWKPIAAYANDQAFIQSGAAKSLPVSILP